MSLCIYIYAINEFIIFICVFFRWVFYLYVVLSNWGMSWSVPASTPCLVVARFFKATSPLAFPHRPLDARFDPI